MLEFALNFSGAYAGIAPMFETRREKVISPHRFARRVLWSLVLSALLAAVALGIGMTGFHFVAGLDWIDALHNASMILGGMGPVAEMHGDAAKLFSSAYALFCGLVFISVVAVTLVPVLHRVLHKFHMDEADLKKE